MAVRDDSKDRPVSTFHPTEAAKLLAFNVTTQKIVDLCNTEVTVDTFDESRHYSTYQRALKGKSAWEEIVQSLEGLMEMQIAHPRRYLPADDPPDVDQIVAWMKQIAGAPWWYEVLKPSASQAAFNAWYSGRPMGKAKIVEVKARVDEWWARVMQACARAEFASLGQSLYNASKTRARPSADTADSYFYTLVVEDGLPVADARKLYQDMMVAAFESHCSLIDLTDPKDPVELHKSRFPGDQWGPTFDKMVADGYPLAIPRTAPAFDTEPWYEFGQWWDRRKEEAPFDLNAHLHKLHFKKKCQNYWDAESRSVQVRREVVEVSQDGVTWRAATDREKADWDNGGAYVVKHRHETGNEVLNSYYREVNEWKGKVRSIKLDLLDSFLTETMQVDLEERLHNAEQALRAAQDDY